LRSFSRAPKMIKGVGGGVGSVLMDMIFPEPAFNPTLDDARRMGFPMGPQSNVLPKKNMTVASNISAPVRKVEVTATTIERKRNVKGQQSVGQRDIDTSFDVAYSSSSRRKNLAIYGIKGVA